MTDWTEIQTNKHQDHVIAHVIGATILGWVIAGEAAHLLLDIGFLWTVYLDGEMNLLPQGVAISELEGDELTSVDKAELAFDADLLLQEGRDARGLKRFSPATVDCMISRVELFAADSGRRLLIHCEDADIEIETSLENSQLKIGTRS